jgi:hypothetical protein
MQQTTIRLPSVAAPPRPFAGLARRSTVTTLLGLLVAAAGIVGVLVYGASLQPAERTLVVAREVPLGRALRADDLALAVGGLPAEARRLAIPAGEEDRVAGRVAARRLRPGTPLTADDLATAPPLVAGLVALPVPLKPDAAPPLAPGQRVDVIALGRAGDAASAAALARGVAVQRAMYGAAPAGVAIQTGAPAAAGADGRSGPAAVILLVAREEAPRIANAAAGAGVALALLPDEAATAEPIGGRP